jgi:hypothetical protein
VMALQSIRVIPPLPDCHSGQWECSLSSHVVYEECLRLRAPKVRGTK